MNLFHNTSTETFVPLSHDNTYLFHHYDKVANFLAIHLDRKYRQLLAKPIKNNFSIQWYSPFEGLMASELLQTDHQSRQKYWEFNQALEAKISELALQDNENTRDWTALLKKVFNPADNLLFSNGKDVSIVWGWKFENNQITRADLLYQDHLPENSEIVGLESKEQAPIDPTPKTEELPLPSAPATNTDLPYSQPPLLPEDNFWVEDTEELSIKETLTQEGDIPAAALEKKASFLSFLKYFAATYWYFPIVLLSIIVLIQLYKSLNK